MPKQIDRYVRETIDGEKAYTLLHHFHSLFDASDQSELCLLQQLTRYVDSALPSGDIDDAKLFACIAYKQNDVCFESCVAGRSYAHRSISLQNMPKRVRHTLAKGVLIDWDMVNAHPTFAYQYATDRNLRCDMIGRLVTDREPVLAELANAMGGTRSEAKRVLLAILFGFDAGKVRWEQAPPPFMAHYAMEVTAMHHHMMTDQANAKLLKVIQKHKDFQRMLSFTRKPKEPEASNLQGALCSYILTSTEADALKAAIGFMCERYAIEPDSMVPMHDGFMMPSAALSGLDVEARKAVMQSLSSHVCSATGVQHLKFEDKAFNKAIDLSNMQAVPCPLKFIVEGDIDAAKALLQLQQHRIRKGRKTFMRAYEGVWTSDKQQHASILEYECMISHIMRRSGDGNITRYAADMQPAKNVAAAAMRNIEQRWERDNFDDELHEGSLGKLFFRNGVWHFSSGDFRVDDVAADFTTVRMLSDYPIGARDAEAERAVWHIMDGIFKDREDSKCFLAHVARALAGKYTDKQWLILQGPRNSGKGVLQELTRAAFGPYVATINANELMMDSGPGGSGAAKQLSWLLDVAHARIIITNEISMDMSDRKCKLDGNKIKGTFSSGGDPKQVRQNYTNEETVIPEGRLFMMCNDLPPITPPDALETHHLLRTDFQYVKPGDDVRDNGDDTVDDNCEPLSDTTRIPCNRRVGDNNLKMQCRQPHVARAFMHMVFDEYRDSEVVPSRHVAKQTRDFRVDSMTEKDTLKHLIQYTGLKTDRLTNDEIMEQMQLKRVNINKLGIRGVMEEMGANFDNKKARSSDAGRSWGWSGVRFRCEADDGEVARAST